MQAIFVVDCYRVLRWHHLTSSRDGIYSIGQKSSRHPRQLLLHCSNTVHPRTYALAPYRNAASLHPGRQSEAPSGKLLTTLHHIAYFLIVYTGGSGKLITPDGACGLSGLRYLIFKLGCLVFHLGTENRAVLLMMIKSIGV